MPRFESTAKHAGSLSTMRPRQAGVGSAGLARMETGARMPRVPELRSLCELYEVSMDELCDLAVAR